MAVRSLAQSTLRQSPQLNSMLAGYQPNAFHHLETVRLGGTAASIDFTNLSRYSDFQHLQIRMVSKMSESVSYPLGEAYLQFNGITTSSYAWHWLYGQGSSVQSNAVTSTTRALVSRITSANAPSQQFGVSVVDILDPFDTTKNTTYRALSGAEQSNGGLGDLRGIHLISGLFNSTNAVTSITILPNSQSFVAGSRFSLYGIKARA